MLVVISLSLSLYVCMCACVCERLLKTNNLFHFKFYVNNQCDLECLLPRMWHPSVVRMLQRARGVLNHINSLFSTPYKLADMLVDYLF